jgi:hypothetical protein
MRISWSLGLDPKMAPPRAFGDEKPYELRKAGNETGILIKN